MAKNIPAKLKFLNDEIDGLRARIGTAGNAVQRDKLEMLTDIRDDYRSAADLALSKREASA